MTPDLQSTGTPRWQPALIVGLMAAVALAFVLGPAGQDPAPTAAPPPTPAGTVPDGAPSAPSGTRAAPSVPAPTESHPPPSARAASLEAPEPFVHDFASGALAAPAPPVASPTAPVVMPASFDGCDHGYGTVNQCVPWQFPPGVTDGCEWLLARGYGPLAVNGDDRLGLDANGDGTACGQGD